MTGAEYQALPISLTESDTGMSFLAYPSKASPRWLLPVEASLRRSSLQLYAPQKFGGRVRKELLSRGFLAGEAVGIPEAAGLERLFSEVLGRQVRLAFLVGTAGAYQKVTVQVMTTSGEVVAYAKLASHPLAIRSLDNERNTLKKLAGVPALRRHVPQVLLWRRWREVVVLLMTAGSGRLGARQYSKAHHDFLRTMYEAFGEQKLFCASEMWRHIKGLYAGLLPSLSGEWRDRYERVLALVEREVGSETVSLTLAHRDFTPWNTRQAKDKTLFVFDWEFAKLGYSLHYDLFHFCFMQDLTQRKPLRPYRLLRQCAQTEKLDRRLCDMLFLAYQIDLCLFYQTARKLNPKVGTDQVPVRCSASIDAYLEKLA